MSKERVDSKTDPESIALVAAGLARTRRGRGVHRVLFARDLVATVVYRNANGLSRAEFVALLDELIAERGPVDGEMLATALVVGLEGGKTEQIRRAREHRHDKNRAFRERALMIYRDRRWPSKDAAAEVIAKQVSRSFDAVRKWLRGVRPSRTA